MEIPNSGQEKGSQKVGRGGGANAALPEKPSPQQPSFCPTFPIKLPQEKGWEGKGQQKPPEGMHLQNPEIEWKSTSTAPRFSPSIPSLLNNVGDRVEKKKKT